QQAAGNITVAAVGAITGANATSTAGGIAWVARNGDVTGANLAAATAVDVRGANLQLGAVTAGGAATLVAGGRLTAGAITAGTDAVIAANGGNLALGDVTAGDDIWLSAPLAASQIATGALLATGAGSDTAITSQDAFAAINGGAGPTGALIRVLSGGGLATGAVTAATGRAILVAQAGTLLTGALNARDGLALLARGAVQSASAATAGLLIVGDAASYAGPLLTNFTVATLADQPRARTGGGLRFTGPVAAGALIATVGGAIDFGTATSGGATELDATGAIMGTRLGSGGPARLTGGTGVTLADLIVAGDATLAAPGGALAITRDLQATGAVTATAAAIALNALGTLTITRADATGGALTLAAGGGLTLRGGSAARDATITAAGDLAVAALDTGGDVTLTGARLNASDLTARGGAVRLSATAGGGTLTAGRVTAGGAITAIGAGALTLTTLTAGAGIQATGAGALTATGLTAAQAIALTTQAGPLTAQTLRAGGAATLTSTGGAVTGADITGGAITLTSGAGAVSGTGLTATGALGLVSAGGTATGRQLTGQTIALTAGGDAFLDGATATGGVAIDSGATARLSGAITAGTIAARSRDIAIAPTATIGRQGTTDTITLTIVDGGAPAIIGGDGTGGGYNLANAEAARLFARAIAINAGGAAIPGAPITGTPTGQNLGALQAVAAGGGDVIVRDLTIAAGAQGNIAAAGQLSITTNRTVRVEGAVRLTGLAPGGGLAIDGGTLGVISGLGSIDLRGPDGGLGGTLSLTGATIYAATDRAIADVAANPSTDARSARLASNDGVLLEEGVLRAGTLRLNATNGVFVQNSGAALDFFARRGFTAGAIAITTQAATPIVINGRLADANGFVTGLSVIPRLAINGATGGGQAGFDPLSTANGCLILNVASCANSSDVQPNDDRLSPALDPRGAFGSGFGPLGLLSFQTLIRNGYPPLIDEPITGVGNEDLWTPPKPVVAPR
ncbi:MAG: hypothetical protein K2X76_01250, partial [Sphingomonas sp.]|nr:hypothetical protein [Sphingomonas sp.]